MFLGELIENKGSWHVNGVNGAPRVVQYLTCTNMPTDFANIGI